MPFQYNRIQRWASFGIWLAVMIPTMDAAATGSLNWRHSAPRLLAWVVFGGALWLSLRPRSRPVPIVLCLLALESASALCIAAQIPSYYIGFLLVVPAWQLALVMSQTVTALWIVVQTLALGTILIPDCPTNMGWADTGICFCVQVLASVTVLLAKREAGLSTEQRRVNRELMATRELLVESSRNIERLRISQELHDVLGHHLAALSIRLEVANQSAAIENKRVHVAKAQEIVRVLLTEVREVVSAARDWVGIDVNRALESLASDVPGLRVHLEMPTGLQVATPEQANALIRCVQELITNTVKHAHANDLWIEIEIIGNTLRIDAHDDGNGQSDNASNGSGLTGMRMRFENLGGGIAVQPTMEAGFALSAWLPLSVEGSQS
jgi:signal transduction histidine kinase